MIQCRRHTELVDGLRTTVRPHPHGHGTDGRTDKMLAIKPRSLRICEVAVAAKFRYPWRQGSCASSMRCTCQTPSSLPPSRSPVGAWTVSRVSRNRLLEGWNHVPTVFSPGYNRYLQFAIPSPTPLKDPHKPAARSPPSNGAQRDQSKAFLSIFKRGKGSILPTSTNSITTKDYTSPPPLNLKPHPPLT